MKNDDKILIQGLINGDKHYENEFVTRFQGKLFRLAQRYTKTTTSTEDLTQELLVKLISKIKKESKIDKLDVLVFEIAKNFCIDNYRKSKTDQKYIVNQPETDGTNLVEKEENYKADIPGSKEFHEEPDPFMDLNRRFKEDFNPKIQKGLNESIEFIHFFFLLKKLIKKDFNKINRIIKTEHILSDARDKIKYEIGHISQDKIDRYSFLKNKYRNEIENEEYEDLRRHSFKIEIYRGLDDLIEQTNTMIFHSPIFNEMANIMKSPYDSHEYFGVPLLDVADNIQRSRIGALRIMFSIWSKVPELKKGENINLADIKFLFKYFKMTTNDTEKNYLFDKINLPIVNIDSIRKSQYKDTPNKEFYRKVVNYIFEKSFK